VKLLANRIRRIGIVTNPEKPESVPLIRRTLGLLARYRRRVVLDDTTAGLLAPGSAGGGDILEVAQVSDLVLVFGGDGTMLRVARAVAAPGVPLLGINVGGLGFLTGVPPQRLTSSIHRLFAGRFDLEERALLAASVRLGGGKTKRQLALNDFVVSRGITSRLIELEVHVNDELLSRYRCDGFITSSPTGSTAYSLAAGGDIVSPDAEVLALTPICPHTLSIRPVVVGLNSTVQVRLLSSRVTAILAADGQEQIDLHAGDTVTIRRSQRVVRLVRLEGTTFFSTLRQKLGWSGSNV
jgi:NAD+ kinase